MRRLPRAPPMTRWRPSGEMAMVDPAAVSVKGDLSVDGAPEEWAAFEACYREPFGERLHVVRGNHDAWWTGPGKVRAALGRGCEILHHDAHRARGLAAAAVGHGVREAGVGHAAADGQVGDLARVVAQAGSR